MFIQLFAKNGEMSAANLFAGTVSSLYAKVRPTVSQALVERTIRFLAEKASPPFNLAIDVGCGTGLNTPFFSPNFQKFIGLDVSATQIDEARKTHPFLNTIYEINDSMRLPCADETVDLITVIQAAHWLDHGPFFAECDRVLKPKTGVIAIMGYSVPYLSCSSFPRSRAALNEAVRQFYNTLVQSGSWHEDRYILDRQYRDITLPYKDQVVIRNDPELYLYKDMAVQTFIEYLSTWSGYREYAARYPRQPLLEMTRRRILSALPPGATNDSVLTTAFPWFLMMCRKKMNESTIENTNELEPYQWQIAGHQTSKTGAERSYVGLFRNLKNHHILKPWQPPPRGDCEVLVYEQIWNDDANESLRSLRQFVPKFYGKKTINVFATPTVYLELEDITANMQKPCITDIKIGAQTWDPKASLEKITTEQSKYAPYAERLCFRFLGMMVYQSQPGTYLVRDKHWGKKVTDNDVIPVFDDYFKAAGVRRLAVVDHVLEKLRGIEQWFSKPTGYAFYSSSILLAYDAGSEGLLEHHTGIVVRMIDFTHVFDHTGCDTNYLNGVRSLIRHIEQYKITIEK